MPLVSIVMANYNYDRYVLDAISSVIRQNFQDWELIVVDDGSTDSSIEKIKTIQQQDKRIKIVLHHNNKGIAKTFNDGINHAKGEYILIMASDDMLKSCTLEEAISILEKKPKYGAVILEAELMDENGNKLKGLFSDLYRTPRMKSGKFFKELLKNNFIMTCLFKKKIIDKYKICFNENLKHLNDWLFWLELSYVSEFIYVKKPLYIYRIHSNSSSCDRDGYLKDESKFWDIIINKYQLNEEELSIILRNKAKFLLKIRKFNTARDTSLKSFIYYPNLTSLLILCSAFPGIYDLVRTLWQGIKLGFGVCQGRSRL